MAIGSPKEADRKEEKEKRSEESDGRWRTGILSTYWAG
jgi:hypothetical protein